MEILESIKSYSSVEEILGPKEQRYCSEGFKNVNFSFSDMVIKGGSLEAKVHVDFSKKWSSKNNENLKPHLGTTEYFNIAVIMSELLLLSQFELDDVSISKSWVSYLKMKTKPAGENSLIQNVKLDYDGTFEKKSGYGTSYFNISIGHMTIMLGIDHEIKKPRIEPFYVDFSFFIKNLEKHFYKTGYKECETEIRDVELDLYAQTIQSNVIYKKSPHKHFGISSVYSTMNVANFVLVAGQLMQVLLYGLEGIRRDQSKNFWLRGLEINFDKPVSSLNNTATICCQTFKELILRGEKWRVVDFAVSLDTLSAKFNMTHQIIK
ncbi:MAG: AvrD family protein [Marinilabiliaceae bacterium]|nr:AvrD family protein [Marinilabiliaceae bacterium]